MTDRKEVRTRALKQFERGCLSTEELFLPHRDLMAEQAKKLIAMVPGDDECHRRGAERTLNGGLALFDEALNAIGEDEWRLKETLTLAAYSLVSAGVIAVQAVLLHEHRRAETRSHGFDEHNSKKRAIEEQALEIARSLWSGDCAQVIRTQEMGQKVHAELKERGGHYVPTLRIVTKWVRSIAPAYARKPGPPKRGRSG